MKPADSPDFRNGLLQKLRSLILLIALGNELANIGESRVNNAMAIDVFGVAVWLFLGVFFGCFLAYGLRSGRMPARGAFYDKALKPRSYWTMACLYSATVIFCLAEAARSLF